MLGQLSNSNPVAAKAIKSKGDNGNEGKDEG